MSPSTAEWLLEISGLTVGSHGDGVDVVAKGIALADQLRAAAASHCVEGRCTEGSCDDCALSTFDGGAAACSLACRLSQNYQGVVPNMGDPDRTAQVFVQAVRAASTAVFHCRRHAHPTGVCWFSDNGTDACGDVLAVAHRVIA